MIKSPEYKILLRNLLRSVGMKLYVLMLVSALLMPASDAYAAGRNEGKSKTKTSTAKTNQTKQSGKSSDSKESSKGKSGQSGKNKQTGKSGQSGKSNKKSQTSKSGKQETSADVKKQQAATAQEIKQTERQIKENEAAVKRGLNELGKLEGDITVSKQKVANAGAKVSALQGEIGKLESSIAKDEKDLQTLRAEYLKAIKAMRAKRKEKSALAFIFSSKNFNEALRRMRYLKEFSRWQKKQTEEITKRVAHLKQQTAELQQTKKMRDSELAKEVKERDNLQAQYAKQDAIVVDLKKNGQALKTHLAKKQAEANALKGRVAALIAQEEQKAEAERQAKAKAEAERQAKLEADRKAREQAEKEKAEREKAQQEQLAQNKQSEKPAAKEENKKSSKKQETKKQETNKGDNTSYADARKRRPKTTSPSATTGDGASKSNNAPTATAPAAPAGATFESMRGSLPRPVAGHFKVTSRFGRQSLPDLPNVSYDNPGIDAEVASGASAQAVFGGKVSGVYMIPGYATVVIVNHGVYYTVYGNLQSASVKVGDVVKLGQALGKIAPDEDDSSHSSIHFEVWKNREKLDPLNWIR